MIKYDDICSVVNENHIAKIKAKKEEQEWNRYIAGSTLAIITSTIAFILLCIIV